MTTQVRYSKQELADQAEVQAEIRSTRDKLAGEREARDACRICGHSLIIVKSTCSLCGATGKQRTGK